MRFRRFMVLVPFWFIVSLAFSAEPKASVVPLDTAFLRDLAQTRGFMLGRPVKPKPTPDGQFVLFLRAEPRVAKMSLLEFDVATGRTRQLITPEQILRGAEEKLSPEEKARRERMRISVGGITDFQLSDDGSSILVTLSGKLYLMQRASGSIEELKTAEGTLLDPKFSPDGLQVGYVQDYDLYVYDLAKGKERRVTYGGTATLSHGLAEFVAQEEMNRFSGFWWSPDSRYLAYEEADAREVEIWHVADPAKPEEPAHVSYYPRPGKANVKVRLGIVPVQGRGRTVWIDWDQQEYPYLARVDWDKHGGLSMVVQTREQQGLTLLQADPKTGRTTRLLAEHDPAWLNLDQQVPKWLEDGSGFLWTRDMPDGRQLELREANGRFKRVLVPPPISYGDLVDLDTPSGQVIFRASADPTQAQLFRVSLTGEQLIPLTKAAGMHSAVYSKDHRLYVHQWMSPTNMSISLVRGADGKLIGELPSVAEEPPFVPQFQVVKIGTDRGFYAEIVHPRNFDRAQRYPVIVDVYGGPLANAVSSTMATKLLNQWLADQGFIVVSVDGRGTPGRGRDWERALYKKFGSIPLEDQLAGLHALGERFPEMDRNQVGIVGWSFGGYMSALAVLKRPDVYKAAVAGAPVVDWLDYDTHYTERYLGLPQKNPEAYEQASLLTYAAQLKRPLLLVHGTSDDNVYFRHTLKLSDALFRAGKKFDLLPLSGLTHMVPDPVITEQLWTKIAGYFRQYLGQPSRK